MGQKYNKKRLVPEQDRRICGSICFCQFTMVVSCVALVYLSVAIYIPSHRAFNAGFEPEPVMCQTTNSTLVNNCNWASCGEWCLTKTSGFCPQIYATTRRNGTDLLLENCTQISTISCPQVNLLAAKKYNCNNGSACGALTGVMSCSLGHCYDIGQVMLCHYKADGVIIDSEKDNTKLNGFFECNNSRCTKIKRPFKCDRYCSNISTSNVNVYLMQDDNLYTARCNRAFALNRANGSYLGTRLDKPEKIWDESKDISIMTSCFAVNRIGNTIRTEDCVNGSLIDETGVPQPYINYTTFLSLYEKSLTRPLDPTNIFLPSQRSLTIYNSSRLYINLEGCVNTLRGECIEFHGTHGRDGDNYTAQSRYPCYYNKNDSYFVVARFDLNKTRTELLIATIVPSCLFFISLVSLIIITRSVQVGDDTKMRCRYCVDGDAQESEDEGLVQRNSSSASPGGVTNQNEIRSLAL